MHTNRVSMILRENDLPNHTFNLFIIRIHLLAVTFDVCQLYRVKIDFTISYNDISCGLRSINYRQLVNGIRLQETKTEI